MADLGKDLTELPLPEEGASFDLANNAQYYVNSLSYENANKIIVVEVVGQYGDAFRKVKSKLEVQIPSVFNNYGLLTNGTLSISGDTTLNMDVHANGGAEIPNDATIYNNASVTQSGPTTNKTYDKVEIVPIIDVPNVPINDLRIQSQSDSILLDISQADLQTQIANAPEGSNIYISTSDPSKISQNNIFLSGNMQGKTIFLDGNINVNIDGANPLSNAIIVTAGSAVVNGSVDILSSHPDEIDVVFACGGDIELNGSRDFTGLFWANGRFTQNGSSTLTGRVIADEAIFVNGSFMQTSSDKVTDNGMFDKVVNISTWQQVSMD